MANTATIFDLLNSFSRKNDVATLSQDVTKALSQGNTLDAVKSLTDLAKVFSGLAEASALSNKELAKLGIDGNSSWIKVGNQYINPGAKFASISTSLYEIIDALASDRPIKVGPLLGLVGDGSDILSAVSLRVGFVPLAIGLKTVSITAGGLSVLFGERDVFPTHIPTTQENLAAGKSPSGGVFGQVVDTGGKYAIFASKNADGSMTEMLIPMQGSVITNNRVASGASPIKYTYSVNGIATQIEYEGSVVNYNPIQGTIIGSVRSYNDSSYELLTGVLSTTDFLSSSMDSESNVFSKNKSKDKFGTIAGIRQAVGALSANEKWGGQTFATASTNLGSYLGNLNYVDPSTIYQNTLVNSFSFNTNFGSYTSSNNANVYIGIITPYFTGRPVVLDLNQNGVELISLDESHALFDMSGTGFRQRTAWVAPSDALLVIDYNDDGVIKERKEINFVDWTNNPTLTDMEALALAFDTNKDGSLDSADADFSKFRVWQDKNADGVSDAGELLTLTQAGIKSIDLKTTKMNWSSGANSISGLGSYTKLDGSQGLLADSAFGHESAGWKAETVNGIQRVISERGDKYAVAGPTGNLVVNNLNNEGLNGAIGGVGSDSMTTSGATPVFMQGNAGNDSLVGGDGDDWLEGGSGSDSISGGSGDDTIIVDSEDNLASISGGAGFDIIAFEGNTTFNIQLNQTNGFESAIGGAGSDNISVQTFYQIPMYWVRGSATANRFKGWADIPLISSYVLAGGDGDDVLRGGYGNDFLDGGKGNDILYGDWGNDTYLFGFGGGKDVVSEVYAKELTNGAQLYMNTGVFPTLYDGPYGPGVSDDGYSWTRTSGPGNGLLKDQSRNSDTIKMGNGVLISNVVLEKTVSASSVDLLIGLNNGRTVSSVTQLDDYITVINGQQNSTRVKVETIEFSDGRRFSVDNWLQGSLTSSTNDTLTGNSSDNVLNGLSGADRMSGGAGNDIYVVDDINDVAVETENQGTDTVESSVTLNAELYANVENLTLVGTNNINGTGNSLSNIITGNAGSNILNGGAGVDRLIGGDGDDTYIVDDDNDTIIEAATLGSGVDTVISSASYSLRDNVENLILTGASAINGTGNVLNNVITGNAAANTLNGGGGIDTLIGGDGNDTYIVDSVNDIIVETTSGGVDIVQSSVTYRLTENVENLILTGTNAINGSGNALNNVITGNSESNILDGTTGADTLIGGRGNDTYIVSQSEAKTSEWYTPGIDLILENDATENNVDTIEVGFKNILSEQTYSSNEGDYSLYLDIKRQLTNDGHDNLQLTALGVYNSDLPITSDEYFGGFLIQDQFKVASKVEQIKFGPTGEVDTMDNYLNRVKYDFFGSDNNDVMRADLATGARAYYAGLGDDFLLGNSDAQTFHGGEGSDILQGMDGKDVLWGDSGNDLLDGGASGDSLYAGAGNDILIGGQGNDQITDNAGFNVLAFNKGDGQDFYAMSETARTTLSIGGISYSDLKLTKSGLDLIIKLGSSDQITLSRWYQSSPMNKTVVDLQVIAEKMQGFSLGGADQLRNNRVEHFDFAALVAKFDAEGAQQNWQLTDARLTAYLKAGSDTEVIGGDIAYQYGLNGSLTGMGLNATQAVLSDTNFGKVAQVFSASTIGAGEAIKLS